MKDEKEIIFFLGFCIGTGLLSIMGYTLTIMVNQLGHSINIQYLVFKIFGFLSAVCFVLIQIYSIIEREKEKRAKK